MSRLQVLILDEPNSYVDERFEPCFYQLLEERNKESAIILVSHFPYVIFRPTGVYGRGEKDYFMEIQSVNSGLDFAVRAIVYTDEEYARIV